MLETFKDLSHNDLEENPQSVLFEFENVFITFLFTKCLRRVSFFIAQM